MRLIRLKVRNIASLKGEHEIDFQGIQKESPLFAITGETGSGKSSILNSIGLALYGQVYKKNVNQLDVVTLGEKDGSIDLIFQVRGKYYLADWKAKVRKQNGELYSTPQTPTRNLYTLEKPEFSSPKNISTVSCPELLNLDFDQFCKCIILNQGEFAKFLNSSFSERKDILEKLYPGEVLDNITKELKLEKDYLEKSKNDLEIELSTLQGDNISGDDLKSQKKEVEGKLKELEETLKVIEKAEYHFVSLFSYFDKFHDNEKKKTNIKSDMAQETTAYNLLLKNGESIHERFSSVKKEQETKLPLLQTYLKKEETLNLLEESWKSLQKKTKTLSDSLVDLDIKLKKVTELESKVKLELETAKKPITHPLQNLKDASPYFEEIFDVFGEKEVLSEEIKGKHLRLKQLEESGKEIKESVTELQKQSDLIPPDIIDIEKALEKEKTELSSKTDAKQRAEIKSQELKNHIDLSVKEISSLEGKITALKLLINKTQEDILPLESTLKLQELLGAKEVCIDHALTSNTNNCPVCEQEVLDPEWKLLKDKLAATDLKTMRKRFDEGNELIFKSQKEEEIYLQKVNQEKETKLSKEEAYKELSLLRNSPLPSLAELDKKLDLIKKQKWESESIKKELNSKSNELQKIREQYGSLKKEIIQRESDLSEKDEKMKALHEKIKDLLPEINRDTIRDLKLLAKDFKTYLKYEADLDKVNQEKIYLTEQKTRLTKEIKELETEEETQLEKIKVLKTDILKALNGEKATDLIHKMNQEVRIITEEWNKHVEEQKKRELNLKDAQGRLYQLNELTKDLDLHFTKELHGVREISSQSSIEVLEKFKRLDLSLSSSRELFIPLKDLLNNQKDNFKNLVNDCRMKFASISTQLGSWEKLQDKIQLLSLKKKDINDALDRKLRLYEVLGKDELRTFVLSLVEENLIQQTNDELQKLCQGRYEIVHQTKSLRMTPEFFILDKFAEGNRRKVSTLSGGETFMVSLAMALGLAEMTRGQAEIDSLFIDEGFGTLDHESLEDVLDMLKQIQTRGLMVGLISHIKTLTTALPVNLVLNKRQDGTSKVSVQFN